MITIVLGMSKVTFAEIDDGVIECVISTDGETTSGIAKCSKRDTFNVHVGRKIAMGRALKSDGQSKAIRKLYAKEYDKFIDEFNTPDREPVRPKHCAPENYNCGCMVVEILDDWMRKAKYNETSKIR